MSNLIYRIGYSMSPSTEGSKGYLVAVVVLFIGWSFDHLVGGAIVAALLAATFFCMNFRDYAHVREVRQRALLDNWVRQAPSSKERKKRHTFLARHGYESAWEKVGASISRSGAYGLPVALGAEAEDPEGYAYGTIERAAVPVYNPDTGTWSDPQGAYNSPLDSGSAFPSHGFDVGTSRGSNPQPTSSWVSTSGLGGGLDTSGMAIGGGLGMPHRVD